MESQSFFSGLFDFSFREYITPKVIRVLFVIFIVFAAIGARIRPDLLSPGRGIWGRTRDHLRHYWLLALCDLFPDLPGGRLGPFPDQPEHRHSGRAQRRHPHGGPDRCSCIDPSTTVFPAPPTTPQRSSPGKRVAAEPVATTRRASSGGLTSAVEAP